MDPIVKFERKDTVAIVTLNRPDSLNAVNRELREALDRGPATRRTPTPASVRL